MTAFRFIPNVHWSMYLEASCTEDLEAEAVNEKGLFKRVHFSVKVGWASGHIPEREIGFFVFEPMPGCCGVVVSTGSFLKIQERGQSFGPYFHDLKAHVAKELGYSSMLATVETSNYPELLGAVKSGWRLNKAFVNKRTGHQLAIMEKHLK